MRVWSTTFKCLLHLLFLSVYLVCNASPASAQDAEVTTPPTESPSSQVEPAVEKPESKPSDSLTTEQLVTELRKASKIKPRKLDKLLQNCQLQVDLASRVISRSDDAEVKRAASLILIRAAKSVYGIDYVRKANSPAADQEFKEIYSQFLDSSDDEILKEAHFNKLVHSMFRGIEGDEEPETVLKGMHDILSRFKGDSAIEKKVAQIFRACMENNAEFAERLGKEFDEGNPKNEQKSKFLQDMFDRHLVY